VSPGTQERPPAPHGEPPSKTSHRQATESNLKVAPAVHSGQINRRRDAALRLLPLDCGCRDPWPCTCTSPPLSAHTIDSFRDAAIHVLGAGCTPLLPIEVMRALWRRGGADAELVQRLSLLSGGAVA
jgi:hypothetical protein